MKKYGIALLFVFLILYCFTGCTGGFFSGYGTSGGISQDDSESALPEKVYIQVRFDLHDSSGGLYKSDQSREMRQLDYQFSANGTSGTIIDGRATYPPGYYFPCGFIVKYGGGAGASNERIAKYDSGIDYYVGRQGLWVTPKTGGTTTAVVYFVFSFGDQIAYDRSTLDLTIPWDEYNPEQKTNNDTPQVCFQSHRRDKKGSRFSLPKLGRKRK